MGTNKTFRLTRIRQCDKCPWRVSTDPYDIPDGYCEGKHHDLAKTIADPNDITIGGSIPAIACHHSNGKDQMYCIGWLHHQLGAGNNINLRLKMLHCDNIGRITVVGEQHEHFEDTLPENKNKSVKKFGC